jgi:hypothetical protein
MKKYLLLLTIIITGCSAAPEKQMLQILENYNNFQKYVDKFNSEVTANKNDSGELILKCINAGNYFNTHINTTNYNKIKEYFNIPRKVDTKKCFDWKEK